MVSAEGLNEPIDIKILEMEFFVEKGFLHSKGGLNEKDVRGFFSFFSFFNES